MPSRCCTQAADVRSLGLQMVIDTHPEKNVISKWWAEKVFTFLTNSHFLMKMNLLYKNKYLIVGLSLRVTYQLISSFCIFMASAYFCFNLASFSFILLLCLAFKIWLFYYEFAVFISLCVALRTAENDINFRLDTRIQYNIILA